MPVSYLFLKIVQKKVEKNTIDCDRTRTDNPQIRSLMPSPLGHTTLLNDIDASHWPIQS